MNAGRRSFYWSQAQAVRENAESSLPVGERVLGPICSRFLATLFSQGRQIRGRDLKLIFKKHRTTRSTYSIPPGCFQRVFSRHDNLICLETVCRTVFVALSAASAASKTGQGSPLYTPTRVRPLVDTQQQQPSRFEKHHGCSGWLP